MCDTRGSTSLLAGVPLFPLPNVVLFPRAVLPLHIFEQRYKVMTAHALTGSKRVAMALLRPGWERDYYGRPSIEPTVCVGRIVSHERLADGCYNFLLQGVARARIEREVGDQPYRQADLRVLCDQPVMEIDLSNDRHELTRLFCDDDLTTWPAGKQFRTMLLGAMPTSAIADLLAFTLIDDVALKQSLLSDTDVVRRVRRVVTALQAQRPAIAASTSLRDDGFGLN